MDLPTEIQSMNGLVEPEKIETCTNEDVLMDKDKLPVSVKNMVSSIIVYDTMPLFLEMYTWVGNNPHIWYPVKA